MMTPIPEYISIPKACKILECDLEDLLFYLVSGHIDAFLTTPSIYKLYPNTGNYIDRVVAKYCQVKQLRKDKPGHFSSSQLLILDVDGSVIEDLSTYSVFTFDEVYLKISDIDEFIAMSKKNEISDVKRPDPKTIAEQELKAGKTRREIAAVIDAKLTGSARLTNEDMGRLLPARPGTTIDKTSHEAQGKRLRGKKT